MLNVPPVGSRLLVLHPGQPAATAHTASKQVVAEIALSDAWQVVGTGANALALDTAEVGRYSPAGDSPYGCADMAGNV